MGFAARLLTIKCTGGVKRFRGGVVPGSLRPPDTTRANDQRRAPAATVPTHLLKKKKKNFSLRSQIVFRAY